MTLSGIWTPAEIETVKRLRSTGLSAHKIAAQIGRSKTVTHRLVYELFGPTGATVRGKESRWTPDAIQALRQLRWDGATNSEIGDRLGFSKSEISKKASAIGCPVKPELLIAKHKPIQCEPSEAHRRLVNEAKKTPEARLKAKYRHLKHDAADAGEFYHLIALPGYGWPQHGLGAFR